jgi:transposase-like protein
MMKCPNCNSDHIHKNGHRGEKQNYICANCGRQFIDRYEPKGYSHDIKRRCLTMHVNGMGFRAIERVTGVSRTTIMNWVKQVEQQLPDAYNPETIPEVGEL